jgi:hypothetical protein
MAEFLDEDLTVTAMKLRRLEGKDLRLDVGSD